MILIEKDFKEAVEKAIELSEDIHDGWEEGKDENRTVTINELNVFHELKEYLSSKGIEWK